MFNALYGTCGVAGLGVGTVLAGGSGITVVLHGGIELGLSAWPAAGVVDPPVAR